MAGFSLLEFIRDQRQRPVQPVESADLTGKTVVVIGANTGLGFEASKHFAKMNPGRLILGCRDRDRGAAALSKLETETGYRQAELWLIDLASFSSVKAFVDKFEKEGGRLDYLILNAAVETHAYAPTDDGWELGLQVNCIAPSLLALLLLPRMIDTAQSHRVTPRLVVVSSEMHFFTSFDKSILGSKEPLRVLGSKEYSTNGTMKRRYPDTKLINVFFVRALAERLGNTPIIVNAVNPGYCLSEFRRNMGGLMLAFFYIMDKFLAFTTEEGSRKLVWAALGERDQEADLRGAYISAFQAAEPSDFVLGEQGKEIQEKLWKETIDILGDVDARVKTVATQYLPRD